VSWAIGYDDKWKRDVGYGVPAYCDHPGCTNEIDRGLSYVCGGEPFGGDHGCGLHFCGDHMWYRSPRGHDGLVQNCKRCLTYRPPYASKPDHPEWVAWKLTDDSWQQWRDENPELVAQMNVLLKRAA
jgi:hypothetical protein